MKDMRLHLEKLLALAIECEQIRDAATEPKKRELFARLAHHHRTLAVQVQRVISTSGGDA
jgi:hypothetical protein